MPAILPNILPEIRIALRQLRKSPGFAWTVLLTLALGICATTVIFSLVDAIVLQPLPLPQPDRLVSLDTLENIQHDNSNQLHGLVRNETSYPNFFDWRSQNKSFSSMASYSIQGVALGASSNGPARRVSAVEVSSDFFTTLGVAPALGRGFLRQEERPGTRVAVLSHDLWKTQFNSDPNILGKTVVLSEQSYAVVGVMPQGFDFPITNTGNAVWITFAQEAEGQNPSTGQRGYNQLSVVGRLRPGVTLVQARAEMNALQQSLAVRYPDDDAQLTGVNVISELEDIVGESKTPLRILFAAVSCLMLIVCANVAGLMLTRTSRRRGELAIRSALGATRAQILRQLLIESILLSVGGGVLGILSTSSLLRVLPAILPNSLPRVHQIALNGQVMAFAVVLSLLTGLLFGVLPAWRASQQDPAMALQENGRSSTSGRRQFRLQSTLVVAQTAIGLVLLVGAGLLIQSFSRTLKVDPGFDPTDSSVSCCSISRPSPARRRLPRPSHSR
jgi:predicted permease